MPDTRRHLVIVRAGDRSLHPGWTDSRATREWDLAVSYYGTDPSRFREPGDRRIDDPGPKWSGLHALLTRDRFWRDYDYIWLPDDDLAIEQAGVNCLFASSAEFRLELAQPALSWRSFYSHAVVIRHPSFLARFTNFIEIMAPCFKREFLEACLPLLGETHSGWGLDWLLPRQTKGTLGCAIVDAVEVTHTRPVGGPNYAALPSGVDAKEEALALRDRHRPPLSAVGSKDEGQAPADERGPANSLPQVHAAIDGGRRHLNAEIPEEAALLQELLRKDFTAFLASRLRVETPRTVLR